MSRHALGVHYVDVLLMLGLAVICLCLRLIRFSVRGMFADIALTIEGHLHRRPDPALEQALRSAFAEFDRELSLTIGDQDPRSGPGLQPGPLAGGVRGNTVKVSTVTGDRGPSAVPQLVYWLDLILETLFNESFLVRYGPPKMTQ